MTGTGAATGIMEAAEEAAEDMVTGISVGKAAPEVHTKELGTLLANGSTVVTAVPAIVVVTVSDPSCTTYPADTGGRP